MYISQVEIDINNRKKMAELNHLGAYHSWVENSFPDEIKRNERTRKLWRIDNILGKKKLLVVSEKKPDKEAFEKYGVKDSSATKDYSGYINSLDMSKTMKFRATLNPVISVKSDDRQRGRVFPHVTVEQQMNYIINLAMRNGFTIDKSNLEITKRSFEKLKKTNQKTIDISKVTFEGLLNVNDKEKFIEVLEEGIGKKKAYGCGLLTVIPTGR